MQTPITGGLYAAENRDLGWALELQSPDKKRIGALSAKVRADLRDIANLCDKWPPPKFLPHIRSMGLRSMALHADDAAVDHLHQPWRSSGFLLAPMLVGISLTRFKG
jgi:hypothetical protein